MKKPRFKEEQIEATVNLVVGDHHGDAPTSLNEEEAVQMQAAALPVEQRREETKEEPESATANTNPYLAILTKAQRKSADRNQDEGEPWTFNVLDLVGLFIGLALILTNGCLTTPDNFSPTFSLFLRLAPLGIPTIYCLLHTFWFADVTLRIHKIIGRKDLLNHFEKLALLHPVLFWPLAGTLAVCTPFYSLYPLLGPAIFLLFLGGVARWLQLSVELMACYDKLNQDGPIELVKKIVITSGYAGFISLCSLPALGAFLFNPSLNMFMPGVATLVTGYVFFRLRNYLLQLSPSARLGWFGEFRLADRQELQGEISIRYDHFVEIQKWFRQRVALRSRWKMAVPIILLLVAAAANLHGAILDALSGCAGGDFSRQTLSTQAGLNLDAYSGLNAAANYWLVFFTVAISLLVGSLSFICFIRAPKRLIAGETGLRLGFAGLSGKEDRFLPWSEISGIKVERKQGTTSAAGEKLVFELINGRAFSLKLAAIASADDRARLLGAIEKYGPQISREAAIEETLRKPLEHNYTELWLQALSAPPRRERLKPLIKGISLDGGRYTVLGELGSGGQGFAYLALDTTDDRQVVLKESILPVYVDINARRKALADFEKEAKMLSSLDHDQVVKLEGFFVEDHRAYLVLEHIDGENLRQKVEREGPMSEAQIKNLAGQMCSILSYLHSLSPPLVHRDFTPDNLILRGNGTLKLIDFNVAQQVEYATTGTVVGKRAYIPPEQFRGQAQPASDIYALGATLYFLVAGRDPTPISVSRPHNDGVAVSAGLGKLIATLTALAPEGRPASAAEIAAILKADDA